MTQVEKQPEMDLYVYLSDWDGHRGIIKITDDAVLT